MCYAKDAGWIIGYKDGTSRPGKMIMSSEAMKILITAKEWDRSGGNTQKMPKGLNSKSWFAPYLKLAIVKGNSKDPDYNPGKLLNRKEFAILLFRTMLVDEMKVAKYDQKFIPDFLNLVGITVNKTLVESPSEVTTAAPMEVIDQ